MKQLARTLGLLMLGLVITGPDLVMAQWVKPGDTFYMSCHRRCHYIYKPIYTEAKKMRKDLWERVNKSGSQHLTAQEYLQRSGRWEKREIWAADMFKQCERKCDTKYSTRAQRQCTQTSHAACY